MECSPPSSVDCALISSNMVAPSFRASIIVNEDTPDALQFGHVLGLKKSLIEGLGTCEEVRNPGGEKSSTTQSEGLIPTPSGEV
ncbi:magnesium-translocating P-type ATPase [Sesbania bispinosa]|nr:magnesium-translocating P-type ATPase [Sesbania bispinosa]